MINSTHTISLEPATPKMNPEIKAAWIKELRSGERQQIINRLHEDEGYCCLGVLCEVTYPDVPWDEYSQGCYSMFGRGASLPEQVMEVAKIDASECTLLAAMNDGGKTFAEIADYIEENL